MRASILKLLSVAGLLAVLASAALGYHAWHWLHIPADTSSAQIVFEVPQGASVAAVARGLHSHGALSHPQIWSLYARFTGAARRIKAGEYSLDVAATPAQWLKQLVAGKVTRYRVTIVEGCTVADMLTVLSLHPKIQAVTPRLTVENLLERMDLPELQHPEGWFYPDTYLFVKDASDVSILERAHRRMVTVLEQEWDARADELPYKNRYEALVMASIIEKESGRVDERQRIAGVFVRRLQKGMRLQTDPTVIYGMGQTYTGNLRSRDLRGASPYNTYLNKGMPPTPIALPGRAAIHAALHPAPGDALYFVARGDGSHFFSSSLAEHREAVEHFQINKRATNYRSAP